MCESFQFKALRSIKANVKIKVTENKKKTYFQNLKIKKLFDINILKHKEIIFHTIAVKSKYIGKFSRVSSLPFSLETQSCSTMN